MDYSASLHDAAFLDGIKELISDTDTVVVKRSIRVYYDIFNNVFSLFIKGELKEDDVIRAWPQLWEINHIILNILSSSENEGVHLICVKFIEMSMCRILSKEVHDRYKDFAKFSRQFSVDGLKKLKEIALMQHIGASVFIVTVKSLIRITCIQTDLHEPITNFIETILKSPPPTLFHHSVLSLNKILKINLLKLLKICDDNTVKSRIIERMVACGASRKTLTPWAPKLISQQKKKLSKQEIMNIILGRVGQTDDKSITENSGKLLIKSSSEKKRKSNDSESLVSKKENRTPEPEDCQRRKKLKSKNQEIYQTNEKSNFVEPEKNLTPLVVCSSERESKTPEPVIQPTKETPMNFIDIYHERIFRNLTLKNVCNLVISNIETLPDSLPADFITNFANMAVNTEKVDSVKKNIASLIFNENWHLQQQLSESNESKDVPRQETDQPVSKEIQACTNTISNNNLSNLSQRNNSNKMNLPLFTAISKCQTTIQPLPSIQSAMRPICIADVDMRIKPMKPVDVDMRILPYNLNSTQNVAIGADSSMPVSTTIQAPNKNLPVPVQERSLTSSSANFPMMRNSVNGTDSRFLKIDVVPPNYQVHSSDLRHSTKQKNQYHTPHEQDRSFGRNVINHRNYYRAHNSYPVLQNEPYRARSNSPGLYNESNRAHNNSPVLQNEPYRAHSNSPGLYNESYRAHNSSPVLQNEPYRAHSNSPGLYNESYHSHNNSPVLHDEYHPVHNNSSGFHDKSYCGHKNNRSVHNNSPCLNDESNRGHNSSCLYNESYRDHNSPVLHDEYHPVHNNSLGLHGESYGGKIPSQSVNNNSFRAHNNYPSFQCES